MVNYGKCLEKGRGMKKDLKQAMQMYKSAAQKDYAKGYLKVGKCHKFGRGVQKSAHEACKYYKIAADLGFPKAMFCYAKCMESFDKSQSIIFYQKAGDTIPEALENLGKLYREQNELEKAT